TLVFSSRIPITPTATTARTSTTNAVRGTATGAGGATVSAARSASARPPVPRRGARTRSPRAVPSDPPAPRVPLTVPVPAAVGLPPPAAPAARGRGSSGADRAAAGLVAPPADGRPGARRADAPGSRRACRTRRANASHSWTYMLNPLIHPARRRPGRRAATPPAARRRPGRPHHCHHGRPVRPQ